MRFFTLLFGSLLIIGSVVAPPCPAETPTVETPTANDANSSDSRMEWWRDARYGMFVHWGLYSGLAGEWNGKSLGSSGNMEWAQHRAKVDTDTYAEQALPLFKPKANFATEWAQLAKQAGCKYLVFTTKHHEGFALHDSAVSEFDAGSVLHRDLVREIVDACRAEGLKIGFYHSLIDWHHDQFAYADSDIPHPLHGKPYPNGTRDHQQYIQYLHQQTEELVTNYGPIDILWWDYSVPNFQGEQAWDAFRLIDMVRQHQPNLVMNNRLFRRPEAGHSGTKQMSGEAHLDTKYGDFLTPEQHVPDTGMPGVDWEACMTMNSTWGYSKHDHNWKSTEQLLHTLIDATSKGGNLLLNIGPMADGTVPQQSVEPLQQVGQWLATHGEAIYGTSASPIAAPAWGRITAKPEKGVLYLHVFEWPTSGKLELSGLTSVPAKATLLGSGQGVPIAKSGDQLTLDLSAAKPDKLVTVVCLQQATSSEKPTTAATPPVETDKRLHSDGSPWGYKHTDAPESDLPRVLLIGDSILNGYRSYVVKQLEGEVIVDAWVNPHYQSEEFNKLLADVLEQDTYDVIHFNIGLHGWAEGRIKPGTFKPLTRAMVQVMKDKQPQAQLIWASSTPVTVKGSPQELHPEINPIIVEHNRLAAEVMDEMKVPVSDFYGLLVDQRKLARGDSFHWNSTAYQQLSDQAVKTLRQAIQKETSETP